MTVSEEKLSLTDQRKLAQTRLPPIPYSVVLQQLLSKIDHAISLAEKDGILTTKLSALLELLSKAYSYSHSVSQKEFTSCGGSVTALDNCDAAFKRFVRKMLTKEEDQAKEELENCEQFAGRFSTGYKQ